MSNNNDRFRTYEGSDIYVQCPRCGRGDMCSINWCFTHDRGREPSTAEQEQQRQCQEARDQHYANQISEAIDQAIYEDAEVNLNHLSNRNGHPSPAHRTKITAAINDWIENPEIKRGLTEQWETKKQKIKAGWTRYQELREEIERVGQGQGLAAFVSPLIDLAKDSREITVNQAQELHQLLETNYHRGQKKLANKSEKENEWELILEQIKKGEMVEVHVERLTFSHLNYKEKNFLRLANRMVKRILAQKRDYEKMGKAYSLTEPSEAQYYQAYISKNSDNNEQKQILTEILNYWKKGTQAELDNSSPAQKLENKIRSSQPVSDQEINNASLNNEDKQRLLQLNQAKEALQQEITNLENKPNKTPEEEQALQNKKTKLKDLLNKHNQQLAQEPSKFPWTPIFIVGVIILIIGIVIITIKKRKNQNV